MTQVLADLREIVAEQATYRGLLYQLAKRDLLIRYKQAVVGIGWALFMPLVNTAVFSLVFARVAPLDVGMPYPLFAFSGLVAWHFSASAFRTAMLSLTNNPSLVTKVYFPREIFPLSSVAVALVDFAVGSIALVAMATYYGMGSGWSLLAVPGVVAVHIVFTTAVALALAMANVFYRDVKYLFEVVITVWMFSSSVMYPVSRVGGVVGSLLALNPMTAILDAYRGVLFAGTLPSEAFGVVAVASCVLLVGVAVMFHRAEGWLAEAL